METDSRSHEGWYSRNGQKDDGGVCVFGGWGCQPLKVNSCEHILDKEEINLHRMLGPFESRNK